MKKFTIGLFLSVCLIALSGCAPKVVYLDENGNPVESSKTLYHERFEIVDRFSNFKEIRDVTTGVHYYMYSYGYEGGLTPVYESDGSIRVTGAERESQAE